MWHIQNPLKVFDYIVDYDKSNDLSVCAIMKEEKYNSFPKEDRERLERLGNDNLIIEDIKIKSPDNPANYLNAKLIRGCYNNL
jgi:hypothetical protein